MNVSTTLYAVTLWVIPAFLLVSCGAPAPRPGDEAAPVPDDVRTEATLVDDGDLEPADGDWLISRLPAEMESLNPYTTSDAYASGINGLIFDSLLDMDNETFDYEPNLAESWEASDDHLTYTFHLREGVVFSDGTPLTADDVKFSFDTAVAPTTNAPHLRNYYQDIVSCEVIDPLTVRFVCQKPYFRHLLMLGGLDIIPKHVYDTGDFNRHPNNRNPIGSGPYVLDSWDTHQQIVLVRNEKYWGEKPRILRRVYKIISNDMAAFQTMLRGELDTMGMSPDIWVERTGSAAFRDNYNRFRYLSPGYSYIGWNMRRPLFEDKRVRRAMTMLLDRELIRETVYHELAEITTGNFFINEPEYDNSIEPWPFDPVRARELLDEAGWVDSTRDGIRDKDGVSFRFELLLRNDSPEGQTIATILQEELARAGIEMTIRQLEWATYLQSVKSHNFDACMLGWSLPPYPDPYQVWHSSQAVEGGSNAVGFVNEEADRLIEEARLVFDRDERIPMYHQFHRIVHEEQPYTFLFCSYALTGVQKRFHNIRVYPRGMDSQEWWVPEHLQRYP